jgi:RimJ/RimL family protein N-acetyltransferase
MIDTERLLLRQYEANDVPAILALTADPEVRTFVGNLPDSEEAAWARLLRCAGHWSLFGCGTFAVIEKASGKWVGRVGPWQPYAWPGTEVGWGLHPDAWGKGYALEAAAASVDYVFDVLQWTTVIHLVNPANVRSRRVAERLGSTLQGEARMPAPFDFEVTDVWGQSRDEWRANRIAP